jgi:hypothetical protein
MYSRRSSDLVESPWVSQKRPVRMAGMADQPSPRRNYPKEWLGPIPARVFACLIRGELRILLFPDLGIAGDAYRDVPIENIPPDLRLPNTLLWVQLKDDLSTFERVWPRDPHDNSPPHT